MTDYYKYIADKVRTKAQKPKPLTDVVDFPDITATKVELTDVVDFPDITVTEVELTHEELEMLNQLRFTVRGAANDETLKQKIEEDGHAAELWTDRWLKRW